jgi:hypothetical protein
VRLGIPAPRVVAARSQQFTTASLARRERHPDFQASFEKTFGRLAIHYVLISSRWLVGSNYMRSPYDELIAQCAFWSGILSFPFAILISILGFNVKTVKNAAVCFLLGVLALTHFFWYFTVLGGALATKVGTYVLPFWPSFLIWPAVIGLLLLVIWLLRDRRRKGNLRPPLPKQ